MMTEETPRRSFIYLLLPLVPPVLVFTPSILPTCLYENSLIIALASTGIVFGVIGMVGAWPNSEIMPRLLKRVAILGILVNIAIIWFFLLGPATSLQTYYLEGTVTGISRAQSSITHRRVASVRWDKPNDTGYSRFTEVNIPQNGCVFKQNGFDGMSFTNAGAIHSGQRVVATWKASNRTAYPFQIDSVNVFILDDQ